MNQKDEILKDEDAPQLAKHAMEYHGLTLKQFVLMCEEAHKRYEGQFSNSVDKELAVECFYEGFKVACKEAQPLSDEQIIFLWNKHGVPMTGPDFLKLVRDVEQAHGIGVKE